MKYSKNRPCVKCGSLYITNRYYDCWGDEYIQRKCLSCGFTWKEDPLDKEYKTDYELVD